MVRLKIQQVIQSVVAPGKQNTQVIYFISYNVEPTRKDTVFLKKKLKPEKLGASQRHRGVTACP